ncbi:MFS general substrate transporter [Sistotremastrum niveocremeum HHB9708]|uniref:MFS general substrate transporter n=1 Tax=Sistotremastrum niveocremeum HHB9708 TaxID=1314777 RepID=A0A164Q2C5_9AGAM|nr:MFS general substrate transporter [Sistotremastrum niveocremeum HHB9708]
MSRRSPDVTEETPLLNGGIDEENVATGKTKPTPLPKFQLACLLFIQVCEPMSSQFIHPFINELIYESGISGGDRKRVGYYTGLVISSYFLAESVSVFFWGRLSDRIGRRPVIFIGLCAVTTSLIVLGFSKTLLSLMVARAISGGLSGNVGILKGMMAEITDESNQARAFSFSPVVAAIGQVVAPMVGGHLSHPVERFPSVFGDSKLFATYPYLLPCLIIAILPVIGNVINIFFLKESLKKKPIVAQSLESVDSDSTLVVKPPPKAPSLSALLTPRVKSAVLNYSFVAFVGNMQNFMQPLFQSTPIALGGLSLKPQDIGSILGLLGLYNCIIQGLVFAPAHQRLGTTRMFRICLSAYAIIFSGWPLVNSIARKNGTAAGPALILYTAQLSLVPFGRMAFSCSNIFLTSAAPSRSSLGATVGLGQTFASLCRSIGPSLAAALFAVSIEQSLLGGYLVYVVLICIVFVALLASFTLPRVIRRASVE